MLKHVGHCSPVGLFVSMSATGPRVEGLNPLISLFLSSFVLKHGSIDGQIRLQCERMVGDGATAFFGKCACTLR